MTRRALNDDTRHLIHQMTVLRLTTYQIAATLRLPIHVIHHELTLNPPSPLTPTAV